MPWQRSPQSPSLTSPSARNPGSTKPSRSLEQAGQQVAWRVAGSVAFDSAHSSSHLHMALSTASGEVFGGHVAPGCTVRTTAEALLALLPDWQFSRAPDAARGYLELEIKKRDIKPGGSSPDAI